jgi:hypothetical protein
MATGEFFVTRIEQNADVAYSGHAKPLIQCRMKMRQRSATRCASWSSNYLVNLVLNLPLRNLISYVSSYTTD